MPAAASVYRNSSGTHLNVYCGNSEVFLFLFIYLFISVPCLLAYAEQRAVPSQGVQEAEEEEEEEEVEERMARGRRVEA